MLNPGDKLTGTYVGWTATTADDTEVHGIKDVEVVEPALPEDNYPVGTVVERKGSLVVKSLGRKLIWHRVTDGCHLDWRKIARDHVVRFNPDDKQPPKFIEWCETVSVNHTAGGSGGEVKVHQLAWDDAARSYPNAWRDARKSEELVELLEREIRILDDLHVADNNRLKAKITKLKKRKKPKPEYVTTEAEYAALPVGSVAGQDGGTAPFVRGGTSWHNRHHVRYDGEMAGTKRRVLRRGWGGEA